MLLGFTSAAAGRLVCDTYSEILIVETVGVFWEWLHAINLHRNIPQEILYGCPSAFHNKLVGAHSSIGSMPITSVTLYLQNYRSIKDS